MDVLHYSFSLSACPKCHLLVCKHTSLANLDFLTIEQENDDDDEKKVSSSTVKTRSQRLSSHGMNFYVLPTTTTISDNRHSWTTFGTGSIGSNQTIENSSFDNETLCDNIPFANENIIHSSLPIKPRLNQLVRTQSERCPNNSKPYIYLTKSYSFSTIYPTTKLNKPLTLSSHIQQDINQSKYFSLILSIFMLSILILSYLITNTLDIVLIYIYYQTNFIYFICFLLIVFTSDFILWINNLIDRKNLSTQILLIPFSLRFHILYELVELMLFLLNQIINLNHRHSFHSSSSSSSTTTTLETNLSNSIVNNHQEEKQEHELSSYKIKKQRLYHYLTLFYLIHSSLLIFLNIYFWSNHFQISNKSTLNMNYFLPQWTIDNSYYLSSSSINLIPIHPSLSYWSQFDHNQKYLIHRTMSLNWTRPKYSHEIPLRFRLPSSTTFILTSIFYHLIINYCLLTTYLTLKRISLIMILSILSRICFILTRIYTLIFLFRLNAWWFTMTFFIVHFSLMIILLLDRRRNFSDNSMKIYLKLIFSFLTHISINDISINAVISLENISIILHRLYLETFSIHNETTLRLIIFLSILISLQIIGFLFDILFKYVLHRSETNNQMITKV